MNAVEKLVLSAVLLTGGVVVAIALHALGVPLPFLPERPPAPVIASDADREGPGWELPPPARPDEPAEDGLLAELGGASVFGPPPPAAPVPGSPGDAPSGGAGPPRSPSGDLDPKVRAPGGRDPLVDRMKAAVDPKDAGQLMAFLIGTFRPRGTKLGEEDLPFLLEALAAQEDYGVRNLLFAHLERIGGDTVTDGVLAFLAGVPDRASAARALDALGTLATDNAAAGLVRTLAGTEDRRLQEAAFRALLKAGNGSVAQELVATLDRSRDASVKRYALAALTQIGGEAGAAAVLRYAASPDPAERNLGRKSLRDLRAPEAVPALAETLGRSPDAGLRTEVVRTLGRIRDERGVEPVARVLLLEPDRNLRMEAVKALAQIGARAALPALGSAASQDANPAVRKAAERAMQYVERQDAVRR